MKPVVAGLQLMTIAANIPQVTLSLAMPIPAMKSDFFSFTPFDFISNQSGNGAMADSNLQSKQSHFYEMGTLGDVEQISSTESAQARYFIHGQQQQNLDDQQLQILYLQRLNEYRSMQRLGENELVSSMVNDMEMVGSEVFESEKKVMTPVQLSSSSFEVLSIYRSGLNKFKLEEGINSCSDTYDVSKDTYASLVDVIRIAGGRYIESSMEGNENFLMIKPTNPLPLSTTIYHAGNSVELAQYLIAAAEKVSHSRFDLAKSLLSRCQTLSSARDNSTQRVIFAFAEALSEKIERETGSCTLPVLGYRRSGVEELLLSLNTELLATYHKIIPTNQVLHFAAVQTILDKVKSKTRIHVIDLNIGCGARWSVFMHALAERRKRPIKILKITAVALNGRSEAVDIGKRLSGVAESLNLRFSYKTVKVREITEIKQNGFGVENGETVVAFSSCAFRDLILKPICLEHLMGVLRSLKPAIMMVQETEASLNSPSFGNRFIEALFLYSAFFDMYDTCFKQNKHVRMTFEAIMFAAIRDVVALDDSERTVRDVKIDVWRAFFSRHGMVEVGFTESSLYQARLVAKQFACGDFCTIDKSGRSLIVGWKGTPLCSMSAWKFL